MALKWKSIGSIRAGRLSPDSYRIEFAIGKRAFWTLLPIHGRDKVPNWNGMRLAYWRSPAGTVNEPLGDDARAWLKFQVERVDALAKATAAWEHDLRVATGVRLHEAAEAALHKAITDGRPIAILRAIVAGEPGAMDRARELVGEIGA